jgi:hypothetical protein
VPAPAPDGSNRWLLDLVRDGEAYSLADLIAARSVTIEGGAV